MAMTVRYLGAVMPPPLDRRGPAGGPSTTRQPPAGRLLDPASADEQQIGTVRLLARAALADLRSARFGQLVALVAVVAWLIFEWGPGNEIAVPSLLMALLNRLDGPTAIVLMPVAGFSLGFGLQMVSGLIAAIGFSSLDHTARAAWLTLRRWRQTSETKDFLALGWAARWGVAFFVGTSAVVLIQLFTTGDARASRHLRAVWISAALVGATIASVAAAVTVAVVLGRRFPALEPHVDRTVALLANPLFWVALLAAGLLGSEVVSRLRPTGDAD